MANQKKLFERRKNRSRYRLSQTANGRPRLTVFRSGMHIYAQVIDDAGRVTLASATSHGIGDKTWNVEAAAKVGTEIAKRAIEKGVSKVIFDRGGYLYHGRVKALAEAAREGGLDF